MEYNGKGRGFRDNMYSMRDACDFAGFDTKYSKKILISSIYSGIIKES